MVRTFEVYDIVTGATMTKLGTTPPVDEGPSLEWVAFCHGTNTGTLAIKLIMDASLYMFGQPCDTVPLRTSWLADEEQWLKNGEYQCKG